MGQAASRPPIPNQAPTKRARSRGGRSTTDSPAIAVPQLLSRRQGAASKPPRGPRALYTLLLGIALGYGLASPNTQQLAGKLLASLNGGPKNLAALINPLGFNQHRILILGRDNIADNTDVMFTVETKDGITQITQVPRDTYIETQKLGALKANSLFELSGIDATKAEVSNLVGVPIDRYLKLNLNAVSKLADALGGVEIDVPKRMYYVDNAQSLYIDLEPGLQTLKGEKLEGFLRFRHDGLGDLGRMERQRLVLAKIFEQLVQPATITKLPALLKIAGDDILTDLSPIELSQLVGTMAHTKLSTKRLPGREYWKNDLSYWMPDSNVEYPTGNGEEPTN